VPPGHGGIRFRGRLPFKGGRLDFPADAMPWADFIRRAPPQFLFLCAAAIAINIFMMIANHVKERLTERRSAAAPSDPILEDLLRQHPGPPDESAGTSWSLPGAKVKRLGPDVIMATGVVDRTQWAGVAFFYGVMLLTALPAIACLAALGTVLFAPWARRTWFFDGERGLLTHETSWPWLGSKVVSEEPLAGFVVRRTLDVERSGRRKEHYAKVWLIRGEQRHRVLRVLVDPDAPKSRKAQRVWRTYRHVSDLIRDHVSRAAQSDASRSQEAASARADGRRTGEMSARPLELRSPPWHPRLVRQEDWRAAVLVAGAVSLLSRGWFFSPGLVDALVAAGAGTVITFAASYLRWRFGEHVTCLLDRDRERLRIERRRPFREPVEEERSLFHLEDARIVRRGGGHDVVLVLRSGEELPLLRGEDLESAHRGGVVQAVREFLTGGESGMPSRAAAARRSIAPEGRHAAPPPPGGKTGPASTTGPAPTTS